MTVSRIPNVEGGIQPTIVTAKGDLIAAVANASPGRLGVGSDGQLLTADSSSATGLSYQNNWAAGKNKLINGDFYINQRSFTSTTSSATYGFDRWRILNNGGVTSSSQTFTLGTAPVSGYEGKTYFRSVTAGQSSASDRTNLQQFIESVRTFAGQTVTVSFWAKAASGTPKIATEFIQVFGTGGSPSAQVNTYAGQSTISTSWARYSLSIAIPSISGKTIGTANDDYLGLQFWFSAGSDFNARTGSLGLQNATIDIWGVQLEAGSTATAFQTATGTIQGELAACQRYYFRMNGNGSYNPVGFGYSDSTTVARMYVTTPPMRVLPTSIDYTNLSIVADAIYNSTGASIGASSPNMVRVDLTGLSGLTAFRSYALLLQNTANQFLGFNSEL